MSGGGQHLIEQDLLNALDSGHLRGAILDVFEAGAFSCWIIHSGSMKRS